MFQKLHILAIFLFYIGCTNPASENSSSDLNFRKILFWGSKNNYIISSTKSFADTSKRSIKFNSLLYSKRDNEKCLVEFSNQVFFGAKWSSKLNKYIILSLQGVYSLNPADGKIETIFQNENTTITPQYLFDQSNENLFILAINHKTQKANAIVINLEHRSTANHAWNHLKKLKALSITNQPNKRFIINFEDKRIEFKFTNKKWQKKTLAPAPIIGTRIFTTNSKIWANRNIALNDITSFLPVNTKIITIKNNDILGITSKRELVVGCLKKKTFTKKYISLNNSEGILGKGFSKSGLWIASSTGIIFETIFPATTSEIKINIPNSFN